MSNNTKQIEKFYLSAFIHGKALWIINYESQKQFGATLDKGKAEQIETLVHKGSLHKKDYVEQYYKLQCELGVKDKSFDDWYKNNK